MKIKTEKNNRKTQTRYVFPNNIIYHANAKLGWSIIIEPDNILIDNFHIDKAHIHYNPEQHYLKKTIKEEDQYIILDMVINHIIRNNGLNLNELKEELKLS